MTPGAARSFMDRLALLGEEGSEARALFAEISVRMYQDGRQDPIRDKVTALECSDLLLQAAEGMGAALASDRANRGAQP